MDYRSGIRTVRALADGAPAFVSALEASPDFDPDAFASFAARGNVREWLALAIDEPRARSLLGERFVGELAETAAAQPAKKRALRELGADVQAACERAGIPILFHKGLYVGDRFYGDVHRRHQYDLDALVQPSDIQRAVQVLGTLGLDTGRDRVVRRLQKIRERLPNRAPQTITLRRPDGPVIDLHCRTKSRRFPGVSEEAFWTDRQTVSVGDWTFDTLSDLHTLLLLTVSLCLDLRRGAARVKHFLDLYLILRALQSDIEWEPYLAAREREGLLKPVATVWTILLSLWECAEEFPDLSRALGRHRRKVRLRDPAEALRIIGRKRGSLENRAWFLSVRGPATPAEWGRALAAHGPLLVRRALRPRVRGEAWPWEQVADGSGEPGGTEVHVR